MKLRKITEIHPTLPMTEHDFLSKYSVSFAQSELGRIYQEIPFKKIAADIAARMPARKGPQGKKPMFPPEGEIALMFLKAYTELSDDGLIEMFNGSFHMQMFCGVLLDPQQQLPDGKIVSAIRNRIAPYMDIKALQKILYDHWKGELKNLNLCLSDATCYESHLRYPTDIKLLWEACEWLHELTAKVCKSLGERQPRNKYHDLDRDRLTYAKQRKRKASATKKLHRRLVALLKKMLGQWNYMRRQFAPSIALTADQECRLITIGKVLVQQQDHMQGKEIVHRIVSIDRPYLRPIIRGKENTRVEFGAKVNNIQIDGLSFIEHHSFEAFNEGIRMKQCIEYQEELTGVKVTRFGGDTIYANNENRSYCTKNNITTCFARKGPKPKDEPSDTKTSRRIIGRLRATVMEGSFGNQKLHYGVDRIAARNRYSETALLFFGIHMSNAAIVAERKHIKQLQEEAKKAKRAKKRA